MSGPWWTGPRAPALTILVEQVTARRPEPHEAKLLGISRSAPVLAVYVSARDASGRPVIAFDVAMPGDLHDLEDAYPIG